jgi:hypothetical protein
MTVVCNFIPPEKFYSHEVCETPDEKIYALITRIIDEHECFSTSYKYVPAKDQNFQNKLKLSKKLFKSKIDLGDEQRKIFGILNKLTEANFNKLIKSIIKVLNTNEEYLIKFSEQMLQYSKQSDMHIDLIIHVLERSPLLKAHRKKFLEIFQLHVDRYRADVSIANIEDTFSSIDYSDYDQFCHFTKFSKEIFNSLKTIVKISNKISFDIDTLSIFKEQIDYIDQWCRISSVNRNLFIYNALQHVEYLLMTTNIKDRIKNDIQQLHLLCIDVLEECNSKKIEFKVKDIMDQCEFN